MRDYIRRKEASPFRGMLEGGLSTRTLLTRPLKAQSTTTVQTIIPHGFLTTNY